MVLTLKRWKSRSSPGIEAGAVISNPFTCLTKAAAGLSERRLLCLHTPRNINTRGRADTNSPLGDAGWSSPVARQAHNLKVVGSNPTPATSLSNTSPPQAPVRELFAFVVYRERRRQTVRAAAQLCLAQITPGHATRNPTTPAVKRSASAITTPIGPESLRIQAKRPPRRDP